MDHKLLEKNLKEIDDKDFNSFTEIDSQIKDLLKIQFLMSYHVVRNTLQRAIEKLKDNNLTLSIWYHSEPGIGDRIESKVFVDKEDDLVTSIEKGDLIYMKDILGGLLSSIDLENPKLLGDLRKYSSIKFHNFPVHLDSLPLIDNLMLNEELKKTYHKTILSNSLSKLEPFHVSKKIKI